MGACLLTLIMPLKAKAATSDLSGVVEQALTEYSVSRFRGSRDSGPMSVIVKPFDTEETYKRENIGVLAAEILVRHLNCFKKLQVAFGDAAQSSQNANDHGQSLPGIYAAKVLVTGKVSRREDCYDITVQLSDPARDGEISTRELSIPADRFQKMLGRYLRWKHRIWTLQPYLQAMYSERYLAEEYPGRLISSSYLGLNTVRIETNRLAIDETAEFTGGIRLTYRLRLMLDVAYTGHGYSTSAGQNIIDMYNPDNPIEHSRLLMYVNASALSVTLCGTARLYGDLYGYAGTGWERTRVDQVVSSMAKLFFPHNNNVTEVRCYFLSPSGGLPEGGKVEGLASLPFLRAGFEWRPRRMGFNFLATYRLGGRGISPLAIAVEEIYRESGLPPRQVSYTTMEVTRYRLPRLSVGAAFSLSL